MNFHDWLSRRTIHEHKDPPPTIVADELIRRLASCGPNGVAKKDLLAGLRRQGSESFDELVWQWVSLGQIETWRNEVGETMLRWSSHGQ